MKKKSRQPAGKARKAGKAKLKPIMRHSREGVRARKRKPAKASRPAKAKRAAKASKALKTSTVSKASKPAKAGARRFASPSRSRPGVSRSRIGRSPLEGRGLGAESAGQSGDTEGLSRSQGADSESVEELVEEGQAFEAGVVSGVEDAPPAGRQGIRTRQVPVDDVPEEYLEKD